jgi:hypothetical protein
VNLSFTSKAKPFATDLFAATLIMADGRQDAIDKFSLSLRSTLDGFGHCETGCRP